MATPDTQQLPSGLVKVSKPITLVLCSMLASLAHAEATPTWCAKNEYTAFNCRIGRKVVSVCTSPHLSQERGYVQYRFGQPGKAMELAYPDMTARPDTAFRLAKSSMRHGPGATTPAYTLRFANDGVRYEVLSDDNPAEAGGAVIVDTVAKPLATYLSCDAGTVESRLASLWNSDALPAAR
jgi:hypothetical protein